MDIYREEILEHWENPRNFGQMEGADFVIEQVNPLCGDEVTFFFKLSSPMSSSRKRGSFDKPRTSSGFSIRSRMTVKDVSFVGNGCAVSMASASMLSEKIKGKSVKYLSKITGEDVLDLIGGQVAGARLKCVFLPLEAIRKLAL